MKVCRLKIERETFTTKSSIGKLYVDEDFFGYTLEDVTRGLGIKIKKETAIPDGIIYNVTIRTSPKYGKVPILSNQSDNISINAYGTIWVYILIHGGNTMIDTEGCILLAKNRIDNDTIQGSLKTEITELIENKINEGYKIELLIENKVFND